MTENCSVLYVYTDSSVVCPYICMCIYVHTYTLEETLISAEMSPQIQFHDSNK